MLIEYITLGDQGVKDVPISIYPPSLSAHAASLYSARLFALKNSRADYICFVDGKEDKLLEGFAESMENLAKAGPPIGWAAELIHGNLSPQPDFTPERFLQNHELIHHGVIINRKALTDLHWPVGCFSFEVLAYGFLAQKDYLQDLVPRYDWRPGPNGARLWPSYGRAIVNSKLVLKNKVPVNFDSDIRICYASDPV